ncbi:hypothetical protein [Streptomyces hesseae]|uniref:Secreted protein n=1 Tax=Streptomyces hesseae TaxID=3075519 RepID=A0ABU2SNJ8_9ACTN|nr:hypothetical protein [Streptomyces sp. DSM 40473]MDT0449944.1 hypothetical protein [Streptomyces sp. DSM 40473]
MRRIAAVLLGTVALLGVLATPASADVGGTAGALVATLQDTVTGVETSLGNLTSGL